jgi:S-(hydroxymethyl)glutathione dehydrogenase/alcohol dehydrogenase
VPALIDAYMEKRIEVDSFITHRMSLENINGAFDLMHEGESIRAVIEL